MMGLLTTPLKDDPQAISKTKKETIKILASFIEQSPF
tara:strand:+ start:568 stop:678 length:111 start_codon:yes stop_codon:yes gene_type:complete